jgi:hypothetical protein
VLAAATGCGGTSSPAPAPDVPAGADAAATPDGTLADAGTEADGAAPDTGVLVGNLRGTRYCEVVLATVGAQTIHLEVYNTQGLNDCPAAEWTQLDPNQIKVAYGADMVVLNGPRYWMLDAFVEGQLVDPTPKTFGTIEMRHAANVDVPAADVATLQNAYIFRQVQRNTVVRFDAGKPVFELLDTTARVFDMQSFSVQKTPQTDADLATLGSRLTLPAGWTFRTRVIAADLTVTAIDHVATVVQDDFANTYQLSQQ